MNNHNLEQIFKNYIDNLTHLTTKTIDNYDVNSKIFDYSLSIDTNYTELKSLTDYKYGMLLGVDGNKKAFEAKLYMKDNIKNNNLK